MVYLTNYNYYNNKIKSKFTKINNNNNINIKIKINSNNSIIIIITKTDTLTTCQIIKIIVKFCIILIITIVAFDQQKNL